jgi:hypothetical protein
MMNYQATEGRMDLTCPVCRAPVRAYHVEARVPGMSVGVGNEPQLNTPIVTTTPLEVWDYGHHQVNVWTSLVCRKGHVSALHIVGTDAGSQLTIEHLPNVPRPDVEDWYDADSGNRRT